MRRLSIAGPPVAARPAGRSGRLRGESGTSLVEVVTVVVILAIAMSAILTYLAGMRSVTDATSIRSESSGMATAALAQVERDVRSGNVIGDPVPVDGVAGMGVVVYTQDRGDFRCVEYRVAGGQLQRRTRAPGTGTTWPDDWGTVTDGVVNAAEGAPAFSRTVDNQTLLVELRFRRGGDSATTLELTSAITGRNTSSYDTPFAEEYCG